MNWFYVLIVLLFPAGVVFGWVTPGVYRRLKQRAQIIKKLQELQADLTALEKKIPAEIAAEWAKIVAKVEKLLP